MQGAESDAPAQARRPLMFFLAVTLLVYMRLMVQVSYFPPYFEGEEAHALNLAKATVDYAAYSHSWLVAIEGSIPQYNKGFGWSLVPFYQHFGYDVRIITYVLPVFFGVFVASFFTLFRRVYPKTPLAAFALVALFSVLCLCLRRYKWHSFTYLTAISVYLYFLPLYSEAAGKRARLWRGLALALFVASAFFYFGSLLYCIPFAGLLFAFSSREQRRREIHWGLAWGGAFAGLLALTYLFNDVWRWRIHDVLALSGNLLSREGLVYRLETVRDYFFTVLLSVPFLVLFVAGFIVSIRRMQKGDRFAAINMVLFLFVWCFELLVEGVNNPDQLNWSMIPTLGVLLFGAGAVLDWLRGRYAHGFALGLCLAALAGWNEIRRFPDMNRMVGQPHVQDRNTATQAALVLRLISEDTSSAVEYYLPDPAVAEADGGFAYGVNLLRVDYVRALAKVTFFKDEEDLRLKIVARNQKKPAVIYMSVGYPDTDDKDTLKKPLLGQRPSIIHPYEDIYHIPFLVRCYRMRSSQLPLLSLEGMAFWLKASEGTQGPGALRVWIDQTGRGNDAVAVRDGHPPTVVPSQINGLPAVRFQGDNALRLPVNLLEGARTGQIIALVRVRTIPDGLNVLWNLGTGWGSTYKYALHFEDFGNGNTNAVPVETPEAISNFFVYDTALDAAGRLTFRHDGLPLITRHVSEAGFQPIPDIGGYGNGCFYGDIAEIILYKRALTAPEQAAVYAYLAKKYQIPAIARNLSASMDLGTESRQPVQSDRL